MFNDIHRLCKGELIIMATPRKVYVVGVGMTKVYLQYYKLLFIFF